MPFDLTANRVVSITTGGHAYRLALTPPTKEQWLRYCAGINDFAENVDGKVVSSFESTAARAQLATECLVKAGGYRVSSGDIADQPNWQSLVPVGHRLAAADVLVAVSRDDDSEAEAVLLGSESVRLKALGPDPRFPDAVTQVSGLIHVFNPPTVEQAGRYSAQRSRSVVLGTTRTGKTRFLGAQATLVSLYDELIVRAEGYLYPAHLIGTDAREAAIAAMDTYHKVAAAEALFAPVSPVIQEAA